jgi:hypothetical protein
MNHCRTTVRRCQYRFVNPLTLRSGPGQALLNDNSRFLAECGGAMYHIIKRGNYRKDLFESVGSAEAFLKKNEISQKEAMGAKEGKKSGLNGAKARQSEKVPAAPDALSRA